MSSCTCSCARCSSSAPVDLAGFPPASWCTVQLAPAQPIAHRGAASLRPAAPARAWLVCPSCAGELELELEQLLSAERSEGVT